MPTVAVMNQVVAELTAEFTELLEGKDVYLSPVVIETPARRLCVLQICDGGSTYSDFEGGVKREHFKIVVGILKGFKVDYSGRYQLYLSDLEKSMFIIKERISDVLEGSYLEVLSTPLLVRPLRITNESAIHRGREKGMLIKELTFLGGLNETRTS